MNPVFAREARERFRSRRSMSFLTLWVVGMALVTYLLYRLAVSLARNTGLGQLLATGYVGRLMFQVMVLVLMTAVIFVIPPTAAVAIVAERERQTFHLLQVSQLSALQLVLGKLWAAISYFLILVVAALPMAALPLIFGGAGFVDVVSALFMILVAGVTFASISIWVSSRARSSRGAVSASTAIVFLIAFFTLILGGLEAVIRMEINPRMFEGPVEIVSLTPNPYLAVADIVEFPYEIRNDIEATPFQISNAYLFNRQGADPFGGFGGTRPGVVELVDGRQLIKLSRPPVFVYTLAMYVLIIWLSLWRAAKAVDAPGGRVVRVKQVKGGGDA